MATPGLSTRYLEVSDWSGLAVARPVQMNYRNIHLLRGGILRPPTVFWKRFALVFDAVIQLYDNCWGEGIGSLTCIVP